MEVLHKVSTALSYMDVEKSTIYTSGFRRWPVNAFVAFALAVCVRRMSVSGQSTGRLAGWRTDNAKVFRKGMSKTKAETGRVERSPAVRNGIGQGTN